MSFITPGAESPDEYSTAEMVSAYEARLDEWETAEQLGFHGVFFAEHHGTVYSVMPSPNIMLAALHIRSSRPVLPITNREPVSKTGAVPATYLDYSHRHTRHDEMSSVKRFQSRYWVQHRRSNEGHV